MAKDRRADYLERAAQCRARAADSIILPVQNFWTEAASTWNHLAETESLISQIEPKLGGAPTKGQAEARTAV